MYSLVPSPNIASNLIFPFPITLISSAKPVIGTPPEIKLPTPLKI